jgi:hypothetical protein
VFVRLAKPLLCFMDSPVAAQYCLFVFGPSASETACVAEGCAFAAVMSDFNLEHAIKEARTPAEVEAGFRYHIQDLVVLPHVHLHSSVRKKDSPGLLSPGGTRRPGQADFEDGPPGRNWGEHAEDILEEVLELIITDFDHAEDSAEHQHDIHAETHQHQHVDGEHIDFDDSSHTESFVHMSAVDTDGPFAGLRRTLHRWHNALQQDCLNPAATRGTTVSGGGGGGGGGGGDTSGSPRTYSASGAGSARLHTRRPSLAHRAPTLSPLTPSAGAGSQFFPAEPPTFLRHHDKPHPVEAEQPLWGPPHLPHESAPLMLEALVELQVRKSRVAAAPFSFDDSGSFLPVVQARREREASFNYLNEKKKKT